MEEARTERRGQRMNGTFAINDAQVHVLEVDSPERPWTKTAGSPRLATAVRQRFSRRVITARRMLTLMDETGIDGAVIFTPSIYGFDNSYSVAAHLLAPERFRVIGRLDPYRSDI